MLSSLIFLVLWAGGQEKKVHKNLRGEVVPPTMCYRDIEMFYLLFRDTLQFFGRIFFFNKHVILLYDDSVRSHILCTFWNKNRIQQDWIIYNKYWNASTVNIGNNFKYYYRHKDKNFINLHTALINIRIKAKQASRWIWLCFLSIMGHI